METKSYTEITRTGLINLKGKHTANQCAFEGHEIYKYTAHLLFEKGVTLDKNGFIIDHKIVDQTVQEVVEVNSCEVIAERILDQLEAKMTNLNLKLMGIKLSIRPYAIPEENSAFFQAYRCKNDLFLPMILNL